MEMQTLECKLLEASGGGAFITSDNPVIVMDEFTARAKPWRSFVGFSQNGFQLILPLSPSLCAFFFDANVYKVGRSKSTLLTISVDDVRIINSLQIQSAERCVYFHSISHEPRVARIVGKHGGLRQLPKDCLKTYPGANDKEEFLHVQSPTVKLPAKWEFCQILHQTSQQVGKRRDPLWTEAIIRLEEDIKRKQGTEALFERMERVISSFEPRWQTRADF